MEVFNKKKKWYILKIKNGYEKIIKNVLINYKKKKKILSNVFLPIKKKIKIINGKKKVIKKNFYPGYLIIKIFLNQKILYKIKNIKGVTGFLNERLNKLPVPLNDNEINNIINKYYKYKTLKIKNNEQIYDNLNIGDNVKIIYGVFKNLNGIIENKNKKKIELSLIILNRKVTIKMKYNQIKKINKKNIYN